MSDARDRAAASRRGALESVARSRVVLQRLMARNRRIAERYPQHRESAEKRIAAAQEELIALEEAEARLIAEIARET